MRRAGLYVLIIGGILYFDIGNIDPFNLPKLAIMSIGLAIFWAARRWPLCSLRTSADAPLLMLWAVALASTGVSGDWPLCVFGQYLQPFHGLLVMALLTLTFEAGAIDPLLAVRTTFRAVPIAVVIAGAWCALQALGLVDKPWDAIGGRVVGTTGAPVFLGAVMAIAAPVCMVEALDGEIPALGLAGLCAAAVALILSRSAGGMVAASVGCAAALEGTGRIKARQWLIIPAFMACLGILVLRAKTGKAPSDSMRLGMMSASLEAVQERPLLGWGPDSFLPALRQHKTPIYIASVNGPNTTNASAHNDIAQAGVTLGLFGLLAYLWLMGSMSRRVCGDGFTYEAPAAAGALIAAFIQAKVNPIPPEALIPVALLCGACCKIGVPGLYASGLRIWSRRAAAVALCLASLRLFAAGEIFARGIVLFNAREFKAAADFIREATVLNPFEFEYSAKRCEEIFLLTRKVTPIRAKQIMMTAMRVAAEAARLHPGNPSAHELYATTALFASGYFGPGLLRDARREAMIAQQLDPTFTFTAQRRIEIAHASRNTKDEKIALADLARLTAMFSHPIKPQETNDRETTPHSR